MAAVIGVSGASYYFYKGGEDYFAAFWIGTLTGNLISFNYYFIEIVSDIS